MEAFEDLLERTFEISEDILDALGFEFTGVFHTMLFTNESVESKRDYVMTICTEFKSVMLDGVFLKHINTDAKLIMFVELIKGN